MKRQPAAALSDEDLAERELWIDVSAHQGEIDWPKVARSEVVFEGRRLGRAAGVVARVGEGKDVDGRAVRNLQGANDAGMGTAVYHYFRADRDGATQAAQVLETIRVAGVPVRFVACDREAGEDDNLPGGLVEGPRSEDLDPELVTDEALEFCRAVEAAGHLVVIYGGQWLHWTFSQKRPELIEPFARWPLWVPWYTRGKTPHVPVYADGAPVWPRWALWQFAGSEALPGRVAGVRTRVDVNWLIPSVLEAASEALSPTLIPGPGFDRDELLELAARAKAAGDDAAAGELVEARGRLDAKS